MLFSPLKRAVLLFSTVGAAAMTSAVTVTVNGAVTDAAYNNAASDGSKLVGGVGEPATSGVNDWMLMEDRRRPAVTAF